MADRTINARNSVNQHNLINIIPNTAISELVSDEVKCVKRERLLRLINELDYDLSQIEDRGKRRLCESYRSILQQLKDFISTKSSYNTLKKCEIKLRELSEKIVTSKLSGRKKRQFITSPDSTEVHIDLTSDEEKNASTLGFFRYSPNRSVENQPDSTVSEDVLDRRCSQDATADSFNRNRVLPCDADNEVSSSENINKPRRVFSIPMITNVTSDKTLHRPLIDVDEILRNVQKKTGFTGTKQHGKKVEESSTSTEPNVTAVDTSTSNTVELIMQLAKKTSVRKVSAAAAVKTSQVTELKERPSFNDRSSTSPTSRDAKKRFSEWISVPSPALNLVTDEMVDVFSRRSAAASTEVERDVIDAIAWEENVKSAILDGGSSVVETDYQPEHTTSTDEAIVARNDSSNSRLRLSNMLEKLMSPNETKEDLVTEGSSNKKPEIQSSAIKKASPVPVAVISPLSAAAPVKSRAEHASVSVPSGSVEVGRRNLISKLSQDIGVIHKVGDSHKISPSLKLLKNDLKKPTTSSSSSVPTAVASSPTLGGVRDKLGDESAPTRDPRLTAFSSSVSRTSASKRIDPRLENLAATASSSPRISDSNTKVVTTAAKCAKSSAVTALPSLLDLAIVPPALNVLVSPSSVPRSKQKDGGRPNSSQMFTSSSNPTTCLVDSKNCSNRSVSSSTNCSADPSKYRGRGRPPLSEGRFPDKCAQIKATGSRKPSSQIAASSLNRRRSSDCSSSSGSEKRNNNASDMKRVMKETSEFFSPLTGIYSGMPVAQTGVGYGVQKLKSTFKIPKINKTSECGDIKKSNEALAPSVSSSLSSSSPSYTLDKKELTDDNAAEEKPSCAVVTNVHKQQYQQKLEDERKEVTKISEQKPCDAKEIENPTTVIDSKKNEETQAIHAEALVTVAHEDINQRQVEKKTKVDHTDSIEQKKRYNKDRIGDEESAGSDAGAKEEAKNETDHCSVCDDADVTVAHSEIACSQIKIGELSENERENVDNATRDQVTCQIEREIDSPVKRRLENRKARRKKKKRMRKDPQLFSADAEVAVENTNKEVIPRPAGNIDCVSDDNANNAYDGSDVNEKIIKHERSFKGTIGCETRSSKNSECNVDFTPAVPLKSNRQSANDTATIENVLPENSCAVESSLVYSRELVNHPDSVETGTTASESKTSSKRVKDRPRRTRSVQGRSANVDGLTSMYKWLTAADVCDDECCCAYDILNMCDQEESQKSATVSLLSSPLAENVIDGTLPLLKVAAKDNHCKLLEERSVIKMVVTTDNDQPNELLTRKIPSKKTSGDVIENVSPDVVTTPTVNNIEDNSDKKEKKEDDVCGGGGGGNDGDGDEDDDGLKLLVRLKSIPSLKNALKHTDSKQKGWFANLILSLDPENLATVQAALKNEQSPTKSNIKAETTKETDVLEPMKDSSLVDEKPTVETSSISTLALKEEEHKLKKFETSLVSGELETTISVASASDVAATACDDSKKAAPLSKNRKRHTNELDRLHADIKKMKRTKNNIFTAIGPRSCRKQPPMYTTRFRGDFTAAITTTTTTTTTTAIVEPKRKPSAPFIKSSDESSSVDTEEEILTGRRHHSRKKEVKRNQKVATTTTTNSTASDSHSDNSSSCEQYSLKKESTTTVLAKKAKNGRYYYEDEDVADMKRGRHSERRQQQQQQQRRRRRKRGQQQQQQRPRLPVRRSRLRQQPESDDDSDTSIMDECDDDGPRRRGRQRRADENTTPSPSKSIVGSGNESKAMYKSCPKSVKLRRYGVAAFASPKDCFPSCAIVLTKCSINDTFNVNRRSPNYNKEDDSDSSYHAIETRVLRAKKISTVAEVSDTEAEMKHGNVEMTTHVTCARTVPTNNEHVPRIRHLSSPSPSQSLSPPPPPLSPQMPTPPKLLLPPSHCKVLESEGEPRRNEEQKKSKKKKKKRKEGKVKPLRLTRLNGCVVATATSDNADESVDSAVTRWNCLASESDGKKKSKKNRRSRSSSLDKSCPNTNSVLHGVYASVDDDCEDGGELRLTRRIASLPTDRNSLASDAPISGIGIASIMVVRDKCESSSSWKLSYKCVTSGCNYDTDDVKMFAEHLSFLHKDVVWNGICPNCTTHTQSTPISGVAADLIDALSHLMNQHLVTATSAAQLMLPLSPPSSPSKQSSSVVAIKEEVPEKHFEVENRSFIGTPIDKATADANICDSDGNGVGSSSGNCDGEGNMSPPKLTPAIPRLRVRRFSGDILSGDCGGRRPSIELTNGGEQNVFEPAIPQLSNEEYASETLPLLIKNVRTVQQRDAIPEEHFQSAGSSRLNTDTQRGTPSTTNPTEPICAPRRPSSLTGDLRAKTPVIAAVAEAEYTNSKIPIPGNPGDGTTNNLIGGTALMNDNCYSCVDSNGNEDKSSTLWPSNNLNLQLSLNETRLIDLYKCNETYNCSFSTSSPDDFCRHLRAEHKIKKGKKVDAKFLKCLYCAAAQLTTPELLVEHLRSIHRFCQYVCPYCVFRACRPVYVLWHLDIKHPEQIKKICISNSNDNREDVIANSPRKPYCEVVQRFHCTHGCSYATLSLEEFTSHLKRLHSQAHILKCHECNQVSFNLVQLLKHYKLLHKMAEYQCVYCEAGFPNIETVKSHLMQRHSFLYPRVVKRRDVPAADIDTTDPCLKYILDLDMDESLKSLAQYVKIVSRNEFSRVTLYRDDCGGGDASEQTSVLSITGHIIDNKLEFDTNRQLLPQQLQRGDNLDNGIEATVDEETANAVSAITVSSPVDHAPVSIGTLSSRRSSGSIEHISVPSSDDDERLVICELENENDQSKKTSDDLAVATFDQMATSYGSGGSRQTPMTRKMQASQQRCVIGLEGKDLYRCVMTDCAVAVENNNSFKEHLRTCDNARDTKVIVCRHCNGVFQKLNKFLNHIHSHGVPRFYCTLCNSKYTTPKKATEHARTMHKVHPTKVIPADPYKNNLDRDIHLVVVPDSLAEKKNRKPKCPKNWSPADRNDFTDARKLPAVTSAVTTSEADRGVTVVFSCEDMETRWPPHISLLPKEVRCGICNTYGSKVRSNLRNHMNEHACGLAANDIINPVPRIGKTDGELMFHKMANYAAYSVKNDDKKVETKDEQLDEDDGKTLKVPVFVPKMMRFRCSAPDCRYTSQDACMLTSHFQTLHPELHKFACPHCKLTFKTSKINMHMRYHNSKLFKCGFCDFLHYQKHGVEKHQQEAHRGVVYQSVITVREFSPAEVERLEAEARLKYEFPPDLNTGNASSTLATLSKVSEWKCNLCRNAASATEDQMRTHCQDFHKSCGKRYKCCLCSFARDTSAEVTAHLKTCHDFVSQVIPIYREVNDEAETISPFFTCDAQSTSASTNAAKNTLKETTATEHRDSLNAGELTSFVPLGRHPPPLRRLSSTQSTDPTCIEKESSNLFVAPFPDGAFKCPFCLQFKSDSLEQMREHIYTEKNYLRFMCTVCGMTSVHRQELEPHLLTQRRTHPAKGGDDYIRTFTRDENLERKVELALSYQLSKIKEQRLGPEQTVDETILIPDSSDDEITASDVSRRISTELNTVAATGRGSDRYSNNYNNTLASGVHPDAQRSPVAVKSNNLPTKKGGAATAAEAVIGGRNPRTTREMFPCSTCLKIYTSPQALINHTKTAHSALSSTDDQSQYLSPSRNETLDVNSSSNPCQQRKRTQLTIAPNEPQPRYLTNDDSDHHHTACRYCCQTLGTSSLADEHELTCVKRARRSPNRRGDTAAATTITTTNGDDATSVPNDTNFSRLDCSTAQLAFSCASCPATASAVFSTAVELAQHERRLHERFDCLHCDKTMSGEIRLNEHLRIATALESNSRSNVECVALAAKEVHMLCALCRFRLPGNTFADYLRVEDHCRQTHAAEYDGKTRLLEDETVKVQVNGGNERYITQTEIAYLRLKDKSDLSRLSPSSSLSLATSTSVLPQPQPPRRRRNVAVKSTARLPFGSAPPPTKIILVTSTGTGTPNVARFTSPSSSSDSPASFVLNRPNSIDLSTTTTIGNGAVSVSAIVPSGTTSVALHPSSSSPSSPAPASSFDSADERSTAVVPTRSQPPLLLLLSPPPCEIIDLEEDSSHSAIAPVADQNVHTLG